MTKEYEDRSSETWEGEEVRFVIAEEGNGLTVEGPMALYEAPSRLLSHVDLGGNQRALRELAKYGARQFKEIIHPHAFTKSLAENPDIVVHYQHNENSHPLGRTRAGTLRLSDEDRMVRAINDLPDNEVGRPMRDSLKRGDIGGISFRMRGVIEKWSQETIGDYTGPVRHLMEVGLGREMSYVTFPGYDTWASVRAIAEEAEVDADTVISALKLLKPEARLSAEQRDALVTVINTHSDTPVLGADEAQKLTQMRERLLALAG